MGVCILNASLTSSQLLFKISSKKYGKDILWQVDNLQSF